MTQKIQVLKAVGDGLSRPTEVAEHCEIAHPTVRRILGQGAKQGIFERIGRGLYILSAAGKRLAVVHHGDAAEELEAMVERGEKVDMVFLDIPYNTAAVRGGNRGIRYETVSPETFGRVLRAAKALLRTPDSALYYMYSNAASGRKEMGRYTEELAKAGFARVACGSLTKLQKDGVTRVRNMRGHVIEPEGLDLYTLSGQFQEHEGERHLDFSLIRPNGGYQTEKPAAMLASLVRQGAPRGGVMVDPFAGSGVAGAEAVKAGRCAVLIEKLESAVQEHILPRLADALQSLLPAAPVQLALNF